MLKTQTSIILPFIILIILAGMLTSCKPKKDEYRFVSIDEILAPYGDSTNKRPFRKIVNQIAFHPTVDGRAVGIGGMQSEQYRRFLWLEQNATEEELIQLTDNSNANVKVYAFMALCNRNSSACKQIFEKHIEDKSQFHQYAGCMQMPEQVNVFFFNYLSDKLSQKEIAMFKTKLGGQLETGWGMFNK